MTKTKIVVTTPQKQILTYIVDSYELNEGMIFFTDKSGSRKGFSTAWCELTEVQ